MAIGIVLRKLSEPEKNGGRSIFKIPIVMLELNKGPGDLFSKPERRGYIRAVLCLQKKPPSYRDLNGAKSRFDDFQSEHINEAFNIHLSV